MAVLRLVSCWCHTLLLQAERQLSTSGKTLTRHKCLIQPHIKKTKQPFSVSFQDLKHKRSSAFRYILWLTRCFLRFDVFTWPALHVPTHILQRELSVSSLKMCSHTLSRIWLAIYPLTVTWTCCWVKQMTQSHLMSFSLRPTYTIRYRNLAPFYLMWIVTQWYQYNLISTQKYRVWYPTPMETGVEARSEESPCSPELLVIAW